MKRTSFLGVVLEGLVALHRIIQLQLLQHYRSGHRLRRPSDSPYTSTFRQQHEPVHSSPAVQSLSHVQVFCNPMDCSPAGSSVHWISQAKIQEWVAISFSRGSSQENPHLLHWQVDSLPLRHQGNPSTCLSLSFYQRWKPALMCRFFIWEV